MPWNEMTSGLANTDLVLQIHDQLYHEFYQAISP
jgi:hypothetical protein